LLHQDATNDRGFMDGDESVRMNVAMASNRITSPDDAALKELCTRLAAMAAELDRSPKWPAEQLRLCGEYGVYEWFIDPAWGGQGWSEEQVVRGYLALSAACITTTFIITQRTGACRRIAGCDNSLLQQRLLQKLAEGKAFATVGISHLTTSHRHVAKPILTAERVAGGFRLNGLAPWVTGGIAADIIVLAATLADDAEEDRQLLVAAPTNLPGLRVAEPLPLVGVSSSSTGAVHLDDVDVADEWVIAGPVRHVMASGVGASTGGLETSTLAIGLAQSAIDFLLDEASRRADLQQPAIALRNEYEQLSEDLLATARGELRASKEAVRQRANSLVLRATQAALAAAKGTGYVIGHPAGRWCREALFFLVWSCPQPVAAANMCELAGIHD
jgi:alkylation response protein AidB-like acyl-CoA dehydrogenase